MGITKNQELSKLLANLKGSGYCITSRRYSLASRIDREDWEVVTKDADLYRRVYSKDTIEVPRSFIGKLSASHTGYKKFRAKIK